MKTLALVAKTNSAAARELAREIRLRHPDREILAEAHLALALGWTATPADALVARADLVIVLGGDGTLIHAARLMGGRDVPILGVNLGSLGFMTEIPQPEFFETLAEVLEGRFRTESRMKLTCRLWREGRLLVEDEVLNDVVLNRGALARIADHEMSIDGEYVTTYKADGVVVSSPTGSTAYSLSAGGPIVHPRLEGVIVTPICSHALTQRSLVVPADRTIRIELKSETADVYLTLDGQVGHTLQTADRIEVSRAPNRIHLVRNPRVGYFGILRQKLHWGER